MDAWLSLVTPILQPTSILTTKAMAMLCAECPQLACGGREPDIDSSTPSRLQSDCAYRQSGRVDLLISVVLYPLSIAFVGLLVVSRKGRWSVAELAGAGLGIVLSLGIAALLNFLGDRA